MSFGHSQGLNANSELEASVLRVAGVPSVGSAREKTLSWRVFFLFLRISAKLARMTNRRYVNIRVVFWLRNGFDKMPSRKTTARKGASICEGA